MAYTPIPSAASIGRLDNTHVNLLIANQDYFRNSTTLIVAPMLQGSVISTTSTTFVAIPFMGLDVTDFSTDYIVHFTGRCNSIAARFTIYESGVDCSGDNMGLGAPNAADGFISIIKVLPPPPTGILAFQMYWRSTTGATVSLALAGLTQFFATKRSSPSGI